MNWITYLGIVGELIEEADNSDNKTRFVGVQDETIFLVRKEPPREEWMRIAKLTPIELRVGLSSQQWDIISERIRTLIKWEVLK